MIFMYPACCDMFSLANSSAMEFCDDLLVEILSRLPFKSLARFKCVSRSWRALISGGDLRRRLPLLPAGLFVHAPRDGDGGGGEPRYATACAGAGGLEYCDMSFFPLVETARVVDACEGLLLYRSLSAASALYVACPATRRWAALPVPRREAQLPLLAFDPADSGGSPSPHYHVVCFVAWQERSATLDVFSSETGAWAERDAVFGGVEASSLSPTTHYRGGVLHVLAYPDRVVLMDLATTMSTTMVLCRLAPRLPDDVDAGARLGHSRGWLHYAKCDGERLRVWALDGGDGASPGSCQWILTNTIRVNEMTINGGRWAASEVKFLAFHPDMADVVYLSSSAGKVASCDMRKKEIVSSWKLGAEHHVVRFWLLGFSSGLMSCLGGEQTCQLASAS